MSDGAASENQKLRKQLAEFVDTARKNEEKMRRINEHELLLISTSSLAELVQLIIYQTRDTFELDVITLNLIDPEYEFTRILEGSGLRINEIPELIIEPDHTNFNKLFNGELLPKLGNFQLPTHHTLFPKGVNQPSCVAVLPLSRHNNALGSLNFGSSDKDRYGEESGTEFLRRLAVVVAICLENTLNHERLKQVGLTDPLTQLNNRRFFDQRLNEEVAASHRNEQPLVCMFFDLDHFKRINDTFGHQAGDTVLVQLSALMAEQLRLSDILCRYGGEEFVALLPNTSIELAYSTAERIREQIAAYCFQFEDNVDTRVTLSIGIASLVNVKVEVGNIEAAGSSLVAAADSAVYAAKKSGRNRTECAG